jgi:putative flippase GtrA
MSLPRQFIRYAIIGIGSNAALYLVYLLLTAWGMGHKTAMTLLYAAGVLQTFLFNKRWTFSHGGAHRGPFVRYLLAYLSGYVLNLAVLLVLVDWARWPHQAVQGAMIIVLAVMLFLLQKYWVFAEQRP